MTIEELNNLSETEAKQIFLQCCGSETWAEMMVQHRPFSDRKQLQDIAEDIWNVAVNREDWLDAFSAHPKIGDLDSLRKKYASTKKWAEGEQSGTAQASEEVLKGLAEGNQKYEDKFGYIFIVCATGKSAKEMLDLLENRLDNDPENEIRIAADEQRKITEIRLNKLLD